MVLEFEGERIPRRCQAEHQAYLDNQQRMSIINHKQRKLQWKKKWISSLIIVMLALNVICAETFDLIKQRNNLHGKPGQGYYIEVEVGTPPQKINVLIDTGSSNFAIAAFPAPDVDHYFMRNSSSTYKEIGTEVYVPYTQGEWRGILGSDEVSTRSFNLTARSHIAFITQSNQFFINGSNWQGIMGLAYAAISRPDSSVLPFFDALVRDLSIDNVFSIQLCGLVYKRDNDVEMGGTLNFGGIDPTLYQGSLYYTPLHKEWYYDIVIVDVKVNDVSLGFDCKEYNFVKTIVDSGTTNLRLPMKVFDGVVRHIKQYLKDHSGTVNDGFFPGISHECWPTSIVPYSKFPVVTLTFPTGQSSSFDLRIASQQYLRPVGEVNDEGPDVDCFKFAISNSTSGTVIGAVAMEGFYVVFDRANKQIGFGQSTCPVRDQKALKSTIVGNISYTGNYKDCAYNKYEPDTQSLTIAGYIMAGLTCVCIIPFIIVFIKWKLQDRKLRYMQHDQTDLINSDGR